MPGRAAFGCVVSFGTATGTTTVTSLTNVTNISGLDGEVSTIDVTSHDSSGAYREMVASFISPGEVTLDVNFDPTSATHKATSGGIMYLRDQRLIVPWQVTFPTIGGNIAKVAFQAFVKNTTVDAPYDDKLGMSVSLQQTGSATWTYTTT
jgi:predicted secreted protein